MTPIDFRATVIHGDHSPALSWAHHLAPIWLALQPEERGTFYASPGAVADWLATQGIEAATTPPPPDDETPICVAGMRDVWASLGRPVALVNHGAGQTYHLDNPSYSGGSRREPVGLFICPSERDAATNLAAYPTAAAVAVGCPRMDAWLPAEPREAPGSSGYAPVIAMAWHWPADMGDAVPELSAATCAFGHYTQAVPALVRRAEAEGWRLIGTAHPMMMATVRPYYQRWGIETVEDSAGVFDRADVLAVDNSSLGFEFWSLDRPVCWIDGPGWRYPPDGPEQWPRFSDLILDAVRCQRPSELCDAVARAVADGPEQRLARTVATAEVYAHTDGKSSARAAEALAEWAERAKPRSRRRTKHSPKG